MRLKRPRKIVLVTSIALLLFIQIIGQVQLAHAGTYVGFLAGSHSGSVACTNMGDCQTNNAATTGMGNALLNPFATTASIVSVSVFSGTQLYNQVVILTSTENLASFFTTYTCTGGGTCAFLPAGHTLTVADVETVSGLVAATFNTVNLASPVSVGGSKWAAVVFMLTTIVCPATAGNGCVQFLNTGGGSPSTVGDICFDFPSTSPVVGTTPSNSRTGNCAQSASIVVGATFQAGTTTGSVTQCYGSCGTVQNTNTTSTVLFNQTFTLFYEVQSQLNGFVNNVSLTLAKPTLFPMYLGLYALPQNCAGIPFSALCPGSLVKTQTFNPQAKGVVVMTTNFQVITGQVLGLAMSSQIDHFAVNDTNSFTNTFNSAFAICTSGCETWQTGGIMPSVITSPLAFSSTIKASLQASITGTTIITTVTPPSVSPACGQLDCIFATFVNSGCSVLTTACTTGTALILVMILTFLTLGGMFYFSVQTGFQPSRVNVGEFGVIAFVGWVLVLTSFNLLPFWVPVFFFIVFASLFSGIVHSGKGGSFI